MSILYVTPEVASAWQNQLAEFEKKFTYPLTDQMSFTIDHGRDYTRFFNHLGKAYTFIAIDGHQVIGCISAALRKLEWGNNIYHAIYIGDLKVDPLYQKGSVLYHLSQALYQAIGNQADFGYGVVMKGTSLGPMSYTGRLNIPLFQKGIEWVLLTFTLQDEQNLPYHQPQLIELNRAKHLFAKLSPEHGWWIDEKKSSISKQQPTWWQVDEQAIACFKDTLLAKRIILTSGEALVYGHLSHFAFSDETAALSLIHLGLNLARSHQMDGLFMTLTKDQYHRINGVLENLSYTMTISEIYLTDLEYTSLLPLNSSEI